jgi:WD40 repeat protein
MKAFAIGTIALLAASLSLAQSKITLTKIYVGAEGLIHLVDKSGRDVVVHKEKDQISVSALKLSPDKLTAGWLIEQENCCTSYPIPSRMAIYRAGKMRFLGDGQMIYDWCFVGNGTQVAISSGTVHGMTSRHLTLYDVRSGRLRQNWNGDDSVASPPWAKDLKQ